MPAPPPRPEPGSDTALASGQSPGHREVVRFVKTATWAWISGGLPGSGGRRMRQAVEIGLVGRAPVKARMGPAPIVEGAIPADRGPRRTDGVIGPQPPAPEVVILPSKPSGPVPSARPATVTRPTTHQLWTRSTEWGHAATARARSGVSRMGNDLHRTQPSHAGPGRALDPKRRDPDAEISAPVPALEPIPRTGSSR